MRLMLILNPLKSGCDSLDLPDCPYGASDCPKVNELRHLLERNGRELDEVKASVIELRTTIKNTAKVISVLISILITIMGVINL